MIKDIVGYEGKYAITSDGRVYSYYKKDYMTPQISRKGYYVVNLIGENSKVKNFRIHKLVAQAFLNNPNNLPIINHKDENKLNNEVNNLEYCDNKYNIRYSCSKSIYCIETKEIFNSLAEAAEKLKGDPGNLWKALNGKCNTFKNYHWKYC